MTGPGERADDASLWQRWRLGTRPISSGSPPDPVQLAAYADGRLDEIRAEPVEDWLASHPEMLADLIAARAAGAAAPPAAPEAVIARASALVAPTDAKIVSFAVAAAVRRRSWRMAAAWSGLAASLLVTSLGGFALGDRAYLNFTGGSDAAATSDSAVHDLLDPPTGLFEADDEPAT
jgi:anti-sigma factor RsiW